MSTLNTHHLEHGHFLGTLDSCFFEQLGLMKHTQKYLLLKIASINSSVKELLQYNLVSFVALGRE